MANVEARNKDLHFDFVGCHNDCVWGGKLARLVVLHVAVAAALSLALTSCSPNTNTAAAGQAVASAAVPIATPAEADAEPADGDTPYEDRHGDADCTGDCSGHEAGYKWARDHDITDEDDCTGDSDSFVDGCKAYVEDNA